MVPANMAGPIDSKLLDDVALVRQVLARELDTINEYEASARAASDPEVRAFFLHLAAEEKEHVAEAVHMLRMLDAGQQAHFSKPIAPGHFQAAIEGKEKATAHPSAPAPGPAPAEPPSNLPPQRVIYGVPATPSSGALPLTVGSLRRSR